MEEMKNVIIADVNETCRCDCSENIHNGTNVINMLFKASESTTPQIEILVEQPDVEEVTYTYDLTFVDGYSVYTIPAAYYLGGGTMSVRFIDGEKICTWFVFHCCKCTAEEIPADRTLIVSKTATEFEYNISLQITTKYGDFAAITDNPDVNLDLTGIRVFKNS